MEISALKRLPQRSFWQPWRASQGPKIQTLVEKRDLIQGKIRIVEPRYCRAAALTEREKGAVVALPRPAIFIGRELR